MGRLNFRSGALAAACAALALALVACGGGEETVTVTQTVAESPRSGGADKPPANPGGAIADEGAVAGYVDNLSVEADTMVLSGWAAAGDLSEPAAKVAAEVDGNTLAEAVPALAREDVVEALGKPGLAESGFELRLPLDSLDCDAAGGGVKVIGSLNGESNALLFGEGLKGRISAEC